MDKKELSYLVESIEFVDETITEKYYKAIFNINFNPYKIREYYTSRSLIFSEVKSNEIKELCFSCFQSFDGFSGSYSPFLFLQQQESGLFSMNWVNRFQKILKQNFKSGMKSCRRCSSTGRATRLKSFISKEEFR